MENNQKPSAMWQSICGGLAEERGIHKTRIAILKNVETLRNEIIPDILESEVAQFKGNAAKNADPLKYLTDCITDWVIAAVKNPDMVY